jgi:hypothetical protein
MRAAPHGCTVVRYNLSIVRQSFFALLLVALLSCGSPTPALFQFPSTAGPWKLKEAKDLPAVNAPEQARRLGLKRAQMAEYEGPGRLEAEVYELTSDAAAFEMEQTWRPVADTVAFHQAAYFAVIRWQNAARSDVSAFVREMQKRVGR